MPTLFLPACLTSLLQYVAIWRLFVQSLTPLKNRISIAKLLLTWTIGFGFARNHIIQCSFHVSWQELLDSLSQKRLFFFRGISFCIEWILLLIRSDNTKLFVAWHSASMYPVLSYLRDSSRNISLIEILLQVLAEEHLCSECANYTTASLN